MRNAFAQELEILAEKDEKITLLSGDIGNRLFDSFKKKFPFRFYNCGVAEANMIGVAAGMAMCGFKPITYTIASFNTIRCLEQIRLDLCYHNLPVIIVGVGAGLSYGSLGGSHHSCEDISFMRTLPNMTVLCPGDPLEVKVLLKKALKLTGPAYLRLGKKGESIVHAKLPNLEIGKGYFFNRGDKVAVISTGNVLSLAQKVTKELQKHEINCSLIQFHTIKPLDKHLLLSLIKNHFLLVTIEEHSVIGGLGSAIAEWLIDNNVSKIKLMRFAIPDKFLFKLGSQQFLRNKVGLNVETIVKKIINEEIYENESSYIS